MGYTKSRKTTDLLQQNQYGTQYNILEIRHSNRPLFPTTLSIPSYDIGK